MTSSSKQYNENNMNYFVENNTTMAHKHCVGTILKTKEDIKLSLLGLWFRINVKVERIKTLLMRGGDSAVEGEPVTDSFSDISNYGVMAQVVARGKWAK